VFLVSGFVRVGYGRRETIAEASKRNRGKFCARHHHRVIKISQ
jgi:hypothetical protein